MTTTTSLRGWLLAFAGLALLIFLAGCGGGPAVNPSTINPINPLEDATKPGSIGGTVFTLAPGPMKPGGVLDQPVNAVLTLTGTPDAGGTYTDTTTSMIRGGFNFSDVPPGIYTLSGSVQAPYESPTVLTGELSGIRVRGNIPTLMTNLMLYKADRGAIVRGTVYKDGLPAGGAVVSVELRGYLLESDNEELYCILSYTASSAPATLGQYELHLPVDGTRYFVSAYTIDSYANDIELLKQNPEDLTILLPGEVRENQDINITSGATSIFPSLMLDIVCSTLPAPTLQASEQAMITRLAVARKFRAPGNLVERLENQTRQARATRTTATGMIENDIYWQTNDDVSTIHGFHVYRGVQPTGDFLYMGSTQDLFNWYYFDNDPALPLDSARFYTVASYGIGGLVSPPTTPVVMALPLAQVTVTAPADGTTLPAAGNTTFSWEAVPNASSYVLTIYPTRPTYNTATYYEHIYDGSQTSDSIPLNGGNEYWWSVSAYNNAQPNYATSISYSAYRKVTTP